MTFCHKGCKVAFSIAWVALSWTASRGESNATLLLDASRTHPSEANFEKLLEYYGLEFQEVDRHSVSLAPSDLETVSGIPVRAAFINIETLEMLFPGELGVVKDWIAAGGHLFVDGWVELPPMGRANFPNLGMLTDGRVEGVTAMRKSVNMWRVSSDHPEFLGPFSGHSFATTPNTQWDEGLLTEVRPGMDSAQVLIEAEWAEGTTLPVVVRAALDLGSVVVDSGFHLRRLGENGTETPLRALFTPRYFSSLAPEMMFIRCVFGDSAWHTSLHLANFTIDDAPLANPYGSLDFFLLLEQMEKENFHTTIAMEPSRLKQSEPAVVELFRQYPHRFSLAVHGNNHDSAECDDTESNEEWEIDFLEGLTRMHLHQQETGIPFSRTMVFPCAMPRKEILPLINKFNLIATVNGQDHPRGSVASKDWDFGMHPVEWAYYAVPAAQRIQVNTKTTPDDIAVAALFLAFLGKPILLYGHETLFKEGPESFNGYMQAIQAEIPEMSWVSLDEAMLRSYRWRTEVNGVVDVEMVTNSIRLVNELPRKAFFRVTKPENGKVPVRAVLVNGISRSFATYPGGLKLQVSLAAGAQANITVQYGGNSVDLIPQLPSNSPKGAVWTPSVCNRGTEGTAALLAVSQRSDSRNWRDAFWSAGAWVPPKSCVLFPVTTPCSPGVGCFFWVTVDPFDELHEFSETNNRRSAGKTRVPRGIPG